VHRGVLPRHANWSTFLRRLRFVVIDECHTYRGVFRLARRATSSVDFVASARAYGSSPIFLLASATVGDPAATASRLTGLDVTAVTDDGSPRGGVTFAFVGAAVPARWSWAATEDGGAGDSGDRPARAETTECGQRTRRDRHGRGGPKTRVSTLRQNRRSVDRRRSCTGARTPRLRTLPPRRRVSWRRLCPARP